MATPHNFSEYYKTISNTELLSILDNPDDYQPLAIEAAKEEFANRKLSDAKIQVARQPLIAIQEKKEKEKAVETKIITAGNTFFEAINPVQAGIPTPEKTIRFIIIVFGGIFLYQFISHFQTHIAFLMDFAEYPLETIFYIFPHLLLPVALFTFWKRKKVGWTLLTLFLTFSTVSVMFLLYQSLTWTPSGIPLLDSLAPPSSATLIVQLLFFVGTLYILSKEPIREIFSVHKQRVGITIGVSGLVTFFFLFAIS